MAKGYIGFRIPAEIETQVAALAESQGITVSEFCRALVLQAITGQTPSVDEGYMQARGLAIQLAHKLISNAADDLPESYEEARARFDLSGPGRGNNGRVPVSPLR